MQSIRQASTQTLFTTSNTAFIEYRAVTKGESAYVSLPLFDDGSLTAIVKDSIKITKHSHGNKIDLKLFCQFKNKKMVNDLFRKHGERLQHGRYQSSDVSIMFNITDMTEEAVKETLKIIQLNDVQIQSLLAMIFPATKKVEEKSVNAPSSLRSVTEVDRNSISSSSVLSQDTSTEASQRLDDTSEESCVIYLPSSPRSIRSSCSSALFTKTKNTSSFPRSNSLPLMSSRLDATPDRTPDLSPEINKGP